MTSFWRHFGTQRLPKWAPKPSKTRQKNINKKQQIQIIIKQIKQVIPHREPFLLIDEIIDVIPGKKVIANKKFTDKDYFFKGHFPDNPIVPGVILIECMAQASCFLSLNLIENIKD